MEDISNVPTEDVEIQRQHTPSVQVTIGSKEFNESLVKELSEGKIWRSSSALAAKLNVDAVALSDFLRKQSEICSRPSKEEGIFFYALTRRLDVKETKEVARQVVTEEDKFALASLHSAYLLLDAALQKYALQIHQRNPEAFTNLVQGKDKTEAGIVLLASKIKVNINKLPKV